jgi:SSS family solute:Na+ symporter
MVSGLFIPTLGAYFWKRGNSAGALAGIIGGGTLTLLLLTGVLPLPEALKAIGLDASIYGISLSLLLYVGGSLIFPDEVSQSIEAPLEEGDPA